ncbi:FecR family protein [Chitinophaga filiformis]|uniref:Ferric-dicitrate binding protein FerR, regulates iron transport through sigma-19 n=1 Tax=Chitinophaga filiformis TaxID=104663 RepID=A0A1G7P7Q9_CHIFI|nr:FecR domain-containing protein [Chitinophaga filiformis]SDF82264.1 ferric-dicitrate binding protein FerR, regulates iron transport through sigma-19 [Chitinophaga filiformis]
MDLQDIRKRLEDFRSGKLTSAQKEELHQALSALSEEEHASLFPVEDYLQEGKFQLPEEEVNAALNRLKQTVKPAGRVMWLTNWRKISRYAAILMLVVGSTFLLRKTTGLFNRKAGQTFRVMRVPDGNQGTLILKDGTHITINGGSELLYPESFEGAERLVYLKEGEAYFDIAQDVTHPFIVKTPQVRVRVLGTSFSIRDYRDERHASVSVNSGKIALEHLFKAGPWLELAAGNGSVIDKYKGTITKQDIDTTTTTAWMRGELAFQDAALQQVLQVLQHKYAMHFEVKDSALLKRRFTATFRNNSIQNIMQQLKLMGNINYTITDNLILIQ